MVDRSGVVLRVTCRLFRFILRSIFQSMLLGGNCRYYHFRRISLKIQQVREEVSFFVTGFCN